MSGRSRSPGQPISILVRNLPLDTRAEEVRSRFEKYGPIRDVYLPRDYYSGRPKGFGFVEFLDARDADDAIYHLDRTMFGGREISVIMSKQARKTPRDMAVRDERTGVAPRGGRRGRSRSRSRDRRRRSPSRSRDRDRRRRSPSRSRSRDRRHRSPSRSRSPRSRSPPPRSRRSRSRSRSRSKSPAKSRSRSRSPARSRSRSRSPARSRSKSPAKSRSKSRSPPRSRSPSRSPRRSRSLSRSPPLASGGDAPRTEDD